MTYTIIVRDQNGVEIERDYHEAVIYDQEFLGEQVVDMFDTLTSNF